MAGGFKRWILKLKAAYRRGGRQYLEKLKAEGTPRERLWAEHELLVDENAHLKDRVRRLRAQAKKLGIDISDLPDPD